MPLQSSMSLEWLDPEPASDIRSVLTIFRQSFFDPWPEERLLHLLHRRDFHGIVLRIDGLICGCLLYHFANPVQEICTLGVLADARHLGVGTRLIQRAQRLGLAMDVTVAAIPASNAPARLCFEKSGFKFVTNIPDHFGRGQDAQLFRWHRPETRRRVPRRDRKQS